MSLADSLRETARSHLNESALVKRDTANKCVEDIAAAADLFAAVFRAGGKVLLCGNGGSAADCQHMATEFTGRFNRNVQRNGLPAIALTTDTSFLTAYANDVGFDEIFSRQVQALGRPGDLLVAISTSGNSTNVLSAAQAARTKGMRVISLTGAAGKLVGLADIAIRIPSHDTQRIQEAHIAVEHAICDMVEQLLTNKGEHAAGDLGGRKS